MTKKPSPNDLCPCGSGKKYKQCCGKPLPQRNMHQVDYVIEQIDADWQFWVAAVSRIIGPAGMSFCIEHEEDLKNDEFINKAVREDLLGVLQAAKTYKAKNMSLDVFMPYGKDMENASDAEIIAYADLPMLVKEGIVRKEQVAIFHRYILDNIRKRFDAYYYAPVGDYKLAWNYGLFAHRGYDYLVGISLYIELQLGVHLFKTGELSGTKKDVLDRYKDFYLNPEEVPDNMAVFLEGYYDVITDALKDYNPERELEFYKSIGVMDEEQYERNLDRLRGTTPYAEYQEYTYYYYLLALVLAICFNDDQRFEEARFLHPECDFAKMIAGIRDVYSLFENPAPASDNEREKQANSLYHETVFYMLDELYGRLVGGMQDPSGFVSLRYIEPQNVVFEKDWIETKENYGTSTVYNPAFKTSAGNKFRDRSLRMELYTLLAGKTIPMLLVRSNNKAFAAGNLLMIPWLSRGDERIIHLKNTFDYSKHDVSELYSEDVEVRKTFLSLEYRLTKIPVNCIHEYLTPSIYYNWERMNQQNIELQEMNDKLQAQYRELDEKNEDLKKMFELNKELLRNLSHSSGNYLNYGRLKDTGLELKEAGPDNPSLEQLHYDGQLLLLQADYEKYMKSRLDSLVVRFTADDQAIRDQIRAGLLSERQASTVSIRYPLDEALKTIIFRILTAKDDRRVDTIKNRFEKSKEDWERLLDSFISQILRDNGSAIVWCNANLCKVEYTVVKTWLELNIIKDMPFSDLIIEILSELLLNAFSHGEITEGIQLTFGESDFVEGVWGPMPEWAYIEMRNKTGKSFDGGSGIGLKTLDATVRLLNGSKKDEKPGVFKEETDGECVVTAWIDTGLLMAY